MNQLIQKIIIRLIVNGNNRYLQLSIFFFYLVHDQTSESSPMFYAPQSLKIKIVLTISSPKCYIHKLIKLKLKITSSCCPAQWIQAELHGIIHYLRLANNRFTSWSFDINRKHFSCVKYVEPGHGKADLLESDLTASC